MNAPSVDIKDVLVAGDFGLVFTVNLFIGKEPATPSNCATIFDTPGRPPVLTLDGKQIDGGYFYPSIQIRVRNSDYRVGWNLITAIKEVLHGLKNEVWNEAHYDLIRCVQEPFLLDWDENGRARFVSTFDIQRKNA